MRGGWWVRLAAVAAAFGPVGAMSDTTPMVVQATPGTGGGGGAVERYTLRFSEPMVPLGDQRAAAPVAVACPVGGEGRWIDPQTFVHEFAGALPGGVTCALTLNDDLRSARGVSVGGQRRFTIDTGGPAVRAILPGRYGGTIEEDQAFIVAANVPADRTSIAANAYCVIDGVGEKIPVDLLAADVPAKLLNALGKDNYQATSFLEEAGLPTVLPARAGSLATVTALKCRRPLPPGRDVALVWGAGVSGAGGRTAGADQRFDFTVRKPFEARWECSRVNPQAGCSPVEPAYVRFSAPVPRATAAAIRLEVAGKPIVPEIEDKTNAVVSEVRFAAPLPEAVTGKLTLPANVRDESGRPLANAARFPLDVKLDAAPPLVKFAAPFGILEAKEGGVLPVTVRNVEPALAGRRDAVAGEALRVEGADGAIAGWLRRIADHEDNDYRTEDRGGEKVDVNYTGAEPLLGSAKGAPLSLSLPGKGRQFEVVGIPLGKPGFYVVELASPTLGRALLGRDTPRYVTAGALVTNLSVHFKWGHGSSLAWVTSLDSGKPVAGADIRVTDSCSGKLLARGTSDAQGRLLVKGELPEPDTYGSCEGDNPRPLMVSARRDGDFSFTMTAWGDGLRPYDFDLPYGWEADKQIFHTIFDRSLIRAGDTVNMKHILRRPVAAGFQAQGLKGQLRLTHRGSDTEFLLPISLGADGIGESVWTAPQGAPMGDYDIAVVTGVGEKQETLFTDQSIRVDEYRLPTMRATVAGPKAAQVRPKSVPLDLFVGYLSGGGASNMPVSVRAAFQEAGSTPKGWEGWSFGGRKIVEGVAPLDGDNEESRTPLPAAQLLPVTLDREGAARTAIEMPASLDGETTLAVEMDYQDANGETLTASQRIALHPSGIRVGIRTDGWLMKADDLRLKLVAIDHEGRPVKGRRISVALYSREILSARRRLIGGFYAYDNNARTTKLDESCTATTDAQGLASCTLNPGLSGEVYAVATAEDDQGNESRAVRSIWLAGDEDWWFGGDNGDRMDLVPEAKSYRSTDTARVQVRMPFRSATALVTVEREGVLSSFVTELSGKDPVVEIPLAGAYAPDVYVSVLAVRGRVSGFRLWLADLARRWGLPFFSREGATPTALVDLAKPSFRMGVAKIEVGWEAHQLAVAVKADKARYAVRETANVAVSVTGPGGKPPASAEIAFAAVDEALLQLQPNESWKLIEAMMGERSLSVLTSTAQTQVVGKRTYGRKAVAAGGGGGDLSAVNREDFRPVLLWRGRVPLDAQGRARLSVPLSDSLSSFRLVAIATAGQDRFGTGDTAIRTTQDLAIYSGLPPLVRSGDRFGASFTLRNGSDRPMRVTATAETSPRIGSAPPLTVTIPAGGAAPVTWHLPAPEGIERIGWTVSARSADGRAIDTLSVGQSVVPAVPLETWAATLARVGPATSIPITAPAGALPGRGEVLIRLTDSLAPPLDGVRRYMLAYPYNCLEQQLSRAVALGDAGLWGRIAGDLPTYLDGDGLLRYFPSESLPGSEALTAYVMSMTAEAGLSVPEATRARILAALTAVVEGRLSRDGEGTGDNRLLRLAALGALARNGAATPAMLGQIGLAPTEMPTGALADWMTVLGRTPGADAKLRVAAEQALRSRLVYEGSRLDLSDAATAPWWMMVSADESAIRALLAILGRPGWQEEGPRMMVGVALRQRRGHWDTTPANAWGAITARRFASLYPPGAVTGTTSLALGAATREATWPRAADATPLRFPLPSAPAPLMLRQAAGAGPWAQVSVTAAVPLTRAFFGGYRLTRQVSVIQRRNPGRLTRGDVLKVRITVDATAERNWVVVNDPIPAGATIVGNLGGQSAQLAAQASDGEGVQPSYVERGQDGWRGYFAWVPRGRFTVEYAVRLNAAGSFRLPPTRVEALYSPEIRAAVPNAPVTVALR